MPHAICCRLPRCLVFGLGLALMSAAWGVAREPDVAAKSAPLVLPADLPLDAKLLQQCQEVKELRPASMKAQVSRAQLWAAVQDGPKGLTLDLSHVTRLLDGVLIDPARIYGKVYLGPYPFAAREAEFSYKRFAVSAPIVKGKAPLDISYLLRGKRNSEGWTECGVVVVRMELYLAQADQDRPLGVYDTFAAFRKTDDGFRRVPWIVEGPSVHCLTSNDPGRAVVRFLTDTEVEAQVLVEPGAKVFSSGRAQTHTVELTGLEAGKAYTYRVRIGEVTTKAHPFQAAPPAGQGPVTFAYASDCREGGGGGMQGFMGVNHDAMERLAALAYHQGAQFLLFGGDLVNGYCIIPEELEAELHAWKQATAGFADQRPIFTCMGNH